jgi:hypothetical protein
MAYLEPAEVDHAWAGYNEGILRVRAAGNVPESCWRAQIRQSIIDIFPPQFEAVRFRTRAVCLRVVTPYVVEQSFELPTTPGDTIVLHHAGGKMDVPVEPYGTPPDPRPVAGYDEAEGRSSRRFDFGEALENAIANLPPVSDPRPDWLDTVEVVGTEAQIGGIAGSHDLVVRVRRARPPS